MLNSEFNAFAAHPEVDLYPPALRAQIDAFNDEIYDAVNNGVYKCGFARQQQPYDEAVKRLFECLDKQEAVLATRRFLCGDVLTEADIRFFVTLIRFDEVYTVHFKCNKRCIREYPNLHAYMLDVYQQRGIADTVNMYVARTFCMAVCAMPTTRTRSALPMVFGGPTRLLMWRNTTSMITLSAGGTSSSTTTGRIPR